MGKRVLAGTMFVLALAACGAPPRPNRPAITARVESALPPPVDTLAVDDPAPGERHTVHELRDTPALWAPAPLMPEVARYRDAVRARLGEDPAPRALLARQIAIYATTGPGDAENGRAVLEGRVGTISGASPLDQMLMVEQSRRFPMLAHPTEFGAFVLRRSGRVRVYFSSMDRLGQRIRSVVTDRVRADIAGGWQLLAHVHIHPFLFDRVPGDRMWTNDGNVADVGGALAPSTNDVGFYRSTAESTALEGAWITNGFDTLRIAAADFAALAGPVAETSSGATAR